MTATTYIIDKTKKRLLLHLHKKFAELYPLGGHIEPNELPHEAALREVKEESGLDVTLFSPDDTDSFILPCPLFLLHENQNKPVKNLDFVFVAFLKDGTDPVADISPHAGESNKSCFFWADKTEINSGKLARDGIEHAIPPHIQRIAALVADKFL